MKFRESHIFLKELRVSDVSTKYVNWLNDHQIVKFTQQNGKIANYKKVAHYVKEKQKSKYEFFYGIFIKQKKNDSSRISIIHVGNIKIGPINFFHKHAAISYLVGEKKYWKKGIASIAIKKVVKIAKTRFFLKKVLSYVHQENIASTKVLLNNKFILEAKLKKKLRYKNKRVDELIFSKLI
tara:strand:+ start:126 stop:668 length:543 start_codon:yes stop_codon:yes gene_type:complete